MAPSIIFGTATFGMDLTEFQDVESVKSLLKTLRELNINRLDSGARYPPLNPGRSEQLIGEAKDVSSDFAVDTKVYTDVRTDGSGDLARSVMAESSSASLKRLQRPEGASTYQSTSWLNTNLHKRKVNVLYAHRADPQTPLEEQIQGFNEQISEGHCKAVSSC